MTVESFVKTHVGLVLFVLQKEGPQLPVPPKLVGGEQVVLRA